MTIYDVENEHKMLTIDFLLLRTTTSLRRSLSERGPAAGGPNLGRPRQKAEAAQNLYLSDLPMKKTAVAIPIRTPKRPPCGHFSVLCLKKKMAIRHEIIGTKVTRKEKKMATFFGKVW